MKHSLILSALLFSILFSLPAETIQVPILKKIKNTAGIKFRTLGEGFYQDKEKLVWAFEIDSLQELMKKENLLFGFYSDLDNNPKTGMPPWDFMFNVRMKQNKLELLSLSRGKYESYPIYPDDYRIITQENILYIVVRKGCIKDKVFGKKFTMRFTSYHASSMTDKDGCHPKYWPDVLVDTGKNSGFFTPALDFKGFLSSSTRLKKELYCADLGEIAGFKVWESFGEKFEENEKIPPAITKKSALQISGARGEWEAVHFAVSAEKPFDSFKIFVSDLKNEKGKELSGSSFDIYYPSFATNSFGKVFTDVLYPAYRKSRSKNHFAVIDAKIPFNAESGLYKGSVKLEINGKLLKEELPLELFIYDFALPKVRTLKTAHHVHPGYLGGGKAGYDLMHKWGFSTHYPTQNGVISWGPSIAFENEKLKIDFSGFEKALHEFFDKNNASCAVCVPFMRGSHDTFAKKNWANSGKTHPSIFTPEREKRIEAVAKEMQKFLKKKGWEKKVIFVLWDEPYSSIYDSIIKSAAIIKKAAPELILGIYIDSMQKLLAKENTIDVWFLTFPSALPAAWKRAKPFQKFWLYNDNGMGSLEAPAAIPRLYGHFAYIYDIEGYLYWCVNMLKKVTRKEGVYHITSSTNYNWYYPESSGKTLYPSLRMMMVREGMDDYEYICLYGRKAGKLWKETLKKHCILDSSTASILFKEKNFYRLQLFRDELGKKLGGAR